MAIFLFASLGLPPFGLPPESFAEDFFRGGVQQAFAVHRPGHAVVNGLAFGWGNFDARGSHGKEREVKRRDLSINF
jgi:hypothetical protein